MSTPNPLENTHDAGHPPPVSKKVFYIAGIITTVFGLDELPNVQDVACLWLLHPRLQTQACMEPVASSAIHDWNARLKNSQARKGLIAVSFDQRNHGSREVNKLANESWKSGNPRHAPDMFSIYHGTALDTSLLLNYLSSYVFPKGTHNLVQNLVLGISLGGHAAWHCLLHDSRITAGIIVIGCPDYVRLMSQRAEKSKRATWISTDRPGMAFLGSEDFPKGLLETVEKYDPAGLLLGELDTVTGDDYMHEPSDTEKTRLRPLMRDHMGGKKILCLSGGADKLVPYKCGEPFLRWLKHAIRKDGGWFNDRDTVLVDVVDEKAGHEYSAKMKVEAIKFISGVLAGESEMKAESRTSKI